MKTVFVEVSRKRSTEASHARLRPHGDRDGKKGVTIIRKGDFLHGTKIPVFSILPYMESGKGELSRKYFVKRYPADAKYPLIEAAGGDILATHTRNATPVNSATIRSPSYTRIR